MKSSIEHSSTLHTINRPGVAAAAEQQRAPKTGLVNGTCDVTSGAVVAAVIKTPPCVIVT